MKETIVQRKYKFSFRRDIIIGCLLLVLCVVSIPIILRYRGDGWVATSLILTWLIAFLQWYAYSLDRGDPSNYVDIKLTGEVVEKKEGEKHE